MCRAGKPSIVQAPPAQKPSSSTVVVRTKSHPPPRHVGLAQSMNLHPPPSHEGEALFIKTHRPPRHETAVSQSRKPHAPPLQEPAAEHSVGRTAPQASDTAPTPPETGAARTNESST